MGSEILTQFPKSECTVHPFEEGIKEYIRDNGLDRIENKELKQEIENYTGKNPKACYTEPILIDRYGLCPFCSYNLDGGDIYQQIAKMDLHLNKTTQELTEIAKRYGWTPENSARFTNLIGHLIEGKETKVLFLQCPSCLHVYDGETGKHFNSLNEARNNLYE